MRTICSLATLCIAWSVVSAQDVPVPLAPLESLNETFTGDTLDRTLWQPTTSGRCPVSTLDIVEDRLRIRMGTQGESDLVVWRGVRTIRPLLLENAQELSFELDWNDQVNGCYLKAGIYLCPVATDDTPDACPDWWKFVYIGVPPGRNARAWSSICLNGGGSVLYNEGWPEDRSGRVVGRHEIRLKWEDGILSVHEDNRLLWSGNWQEFGWRNAYLYLQLSSHSNYPAREAFFDNVLFNTQSVGE